MMHKRSKSMFAFMLFVFLLSARFANGQATTTGGLIGTVVDPSGSVIPGATITILRPSVGFQRTVTANAEGGYVLEDLQAGEYQLRVSAKGFADSLYTSIVIATGRTYNQNIQMKLGAATDTVSVSSSGEALEITTNTLDTTVLPDEVQDLPLPGRDVLNLAQLVPGAQSGGDTRFTTYNALPPAALNITVDGMNDNFQRFRSNSSGFFEAAPLRLGAIEEMTVSTDDLTADAGAEGAVALRFEVKRGTNQFHGSAFWQTQNSAFNANTYENNAEGIAKPPYHLNDEGGSISGPFWKNKLFFFFNYEQEYVPGTTEGTNFILTQAGQQGNFSYTGTDNAVHTVNLLNIAAANGFPSAVNPAVASQFSSINTYSAKSSLQATVLPYEDESVWTYSTTQKNIYPTLRVDYQITPSIDWHAAYNLYWRKDPGNQVYSGDAALTNAFDSSYSTLTSGLDWTITPQMVNHINFGLLNTQEEFNAGNSFNPFASENNVIIDAPTLVNGGTSLSPIIPNYSLPEPRNNPVKDLFDNLTWTYRRHTFTFGGDWRSSTDFDTGIADPAGNDLGINTLDPALSMFNNHANFPALNYTETNNQDLFNAEYLYSTLTGRINNISGTNFVNSATKQYQTLGNFREAEAQKVGGFYFQDAWRILPTLAINYGMRWQFSGSIHNTNDTYTGPTFANLLGPSGGLFQPGTLNGVQNPEITLRPHPYSADLLEPAPNVGFAWNPHEFDNGNLVIRGGAAISHYDEDWSMFEQVTEYANPGTFQDVYLNAGPATNTPPGEFPAGSLSLGATPTLNTFPSSFKFPQPESGSTFANQSFGTVDPNLRSPYIENWYFGIQQKVRGNTVLEVNYVGNHSVHMWQVYDMNEVNIFENGFLQEFKNAQANYAASGGSTFAGAAPTPIMSQAFGAGSSNFTNSTYLSYLGTGQAAALANVIASNSNFFCSLVGNGGGAFSPCSSLGFASPTAYPINILQANPYATGEPIQLLSDPGSESYNGLQAQVRHPAGKNLTLMANYAYSHAFTNRYIGDYFTADEGLDNYTTLRDPRLNRAPSPYDQRHTFRSYALYRLPFESSNPLLKEATNGWTVSTTFTWQKGRNFKMLGGTNTYNYYDNPSNIPDGSDSGVVLNGITPRQLQKQVGYYPGPNTVTPRLLMNPKVFTSGEVTPEMTPGELGQFIYLTGPQFVNDDLAVTKVFPIYRRFILNFQAEMLNVFNHPAWSLIDGFSGGTNNPAQYVNVTSNPVAPATQTNPEGLNSGGARDIQFRLNLAF
jgi:hypothetical protein